MMKLLFNLALFSVLLFSCKEQHKPAAPLFELMDQTGVDFTNTVHNTKDFNIFSYRNFYNGGGVATGDINNDGLPDIFFTANMGSNKLYLNKGNFKFEDITAKAGFTDKSKWGTGVVMADINSDGWLDIYVCNAGYQQGVSNENELYINNKNGSFTESAKQYGLNDSGYTTHAAFFDYDMDGDLDCYILKNSFIPVNTLNYANKRDLRAEDWPVADFLKGGGDKLYKNENGKFVDASKEANIYGSLIGFGLGVTIGDVNGDLYPDIYISNDFFERDYLYINQKNGTFKEQLESRVQHTSLASMGADIGDINNDGYPDIFTTDMLPDDDYRMKTTSLFDNIDVYNLKVNQGFYHQFMQNTLQLNNGNGKFTDIAHYSGVAASDWSWGGIMFDADNDGYNDLYVCNGIYHDVTDQDFIDFFANDVIQKMVIGGKKEEVDEIVNKMPSHAIVNKAFRNNGKLQFSDEGTNWGFTQPSFSNGAAYADLDNDGDLDLVVNNVNQKAFVYKNNSRQLTKNHFIGIKLNGKAPNTFAVGSTVKVYAGQQVFTREVIPSRGFQSSIDYKIIIGTGTNAIDSMLIIWPNRTFTTIQHPKADSVYNLMQSGNELSYKIIAQKVEQIFKTVQSNFEKHQEDDYVDFYYERGLPFMLSKQGPQAATGDVNDDGLADIYIGGTAVKPGQLYLQTNTGFTRSKQTAFTSTGVEDVATLFFDCDKDGDLDLLVGSGGNNYPANSFQMQHRLYVNDGKGNFTLSTNALPQSGMNAAIAVTGDIDNDGDEDLFIGSRNVPQNYGPTPPSFLWLNDGAGHFTSADNTSNKELLNAGLITGAAFADMNGDGKKELVISGEWMSPKIFTYNKDHFQPLQTNLDSLQGLWQTVTADDIDNDGDADLILGNVGSNCYLKPASSAPVKMWIYDFDNNGTEEKIITRTYKGKDVPVFLKKDLTDQIPSLRKKNLKYVDFANKSIQELFPAEILQKAIVKTFNYSSSVIAVNNGKGQFEIKVLPANVQFSSVNAILSTDINNDGLKDLLMGGNLFDMQPQFSRLDASYGHTLINKGKGIFEYVTNARSGIELNGAIKTIKEIPGKNKPYFLVLQNNDSVKLYQRNMVIAGKK
jgi:hypothetical protein